MTGTPRSTNGFSTVMVRNASSLACSTIPTDRKVRPQHNGRMAEAGTPGGSRLATR